jgi:cobalt-zinc-cadmium efflux system protein
VRSIHHTHIWSLDGEHHVLTTHLVLENISEFCQIDQVRQSALEALKEYGFYHYTIKVELDPKTCKLNDENT